MNMIAANLGFDPKELVARAIKSGLIKTTSQAEQEAKAAKQSARTKWSLLMARKYMAKRRAKLKARGLTCAGTVRIRGSHPDLKGLPRDVYKKVLGKRLRDAKRKVK